MNEITSEAIVAGGLLSISALIIIGSLLAIFPRKEKRPKIDIEAAVKNAPYHRLAEVGINVRMPEDK
ncbi:hypothetical protein WNY61_07880 [Sulfitobacter sp. AS92]|uniref:hypothetical protein n=1 Tax=Sulfitobacter sp. AS92 TaxID=3135783 RepID=UPI0031768BD4